MAYDSTSDPVLERIISNFETTLRGIQGPPAFHHRAVDVKRFCGNPMLFPNYPAIGFVPGAVRFNDQRLALIECVLPITVQAMVKSQRWQRDIVTFCTDIQVAVLTDHTRGGVAVTTRGALTDMLDSEPSSPLGGAQMEFEVVYRTLYHDPGSPI